MSLKKWIRTVSNLVDLISFHLICQMLAKFSWLNPKGPYVSLEKGGRVKLGSFMSQLCSGWEMYKKDWSTCKVFFCQSKPIGFFAVYRRRCKNSLLLWSRNFATMVTWHHTSPLYSPACGNSHSITTKFLPKPNHPYPSQKPNRLLAHRQKRNGTSGILTWGKSRASLPIPFFTSLL